MDPELSEDKALPDVPPIFSTSTSTLFTDSTNPDEDGSECDYKWSRVPTPIPTTTTRNSVNVVKLDVDISIN